MFIIQKKTDCKETYRDFHNVYKEIYKDDDE